ncbi:hypothetical protein ACEZCY_19260 [Streptacidiphilus sp. N1-12]|uniref:Uncharacterized protein n=2 Tax=Streptacidiphilus alkalitolerans TaxID=3342712 RepID=A0ABV6VBL0_9ACTN
MPQPPAAALRAVIGALDSPNAVRAVRTAGMRRRTGVLTPAHPLPVHMFAPAPAGLPTAGASAPTALAGARRTGWRFLIRDGEEIVAAADTRETAEGQTFSHFAEGPYPLATLRALQQAKQHTAGSPTVYLPRLLSVPGHYMTALWLHPVLDPSHSADLLIPLAPAPLGITSHLPHDADELLSLLPLGDGQLLTATH